MKRKAIYALTALFALTLAYLASRLPGKDDPYILPQSPGWEVRKLLNVGDAADNGFRMAGAPDGLGAYANADGTFTLLMNHEIGADKGIVRKHGNKGAFISRWTIDVETLRVTSGTDLIERTEPENLVFAKFCSADLAPLSALFDSSTGRGYHQRLFMNGEEKKTGGRAFAHTLDGTTYELADLGKIAWENALAQPLSGDTTAVIGLDDNYDGLVLIHIGHKTSQGNPIQKAGLTGGKLFSIQVSDGRFRLVELPDAASLDYKALKQLAIRLGITRFERPEDGAWDPLRPGVFWFAVTDRLGGQSQLNKLTFDDPDNLLSGGRFDVALHAREIGGEMFDNLTVDASGRVLVQEDSGDNPHLASIWLFDPETRAVRKIFQSDPARFGSLWPTRITDDEEHSGIIEITDLLTTASWFDASKRYYLGTTQAHHDHPDPELVSYGQLWLISGPGK